MHGDLPPYKHFITEERDSGQQSLPSKGTPGWLVEKSASANQLTRKEKGVRVKPGCPGARKGLCRGSVPRRDRGETCLKPALGSLQRWSQGVTLANQRTTR